jgi:hypothetical protein
VKKKIQFQQSLKNLVKNKDFFWMDFPAAKPRREFVAQQLHQPHDVPDSLKPFCIVMHATSIQSAIYPVREGQEWPNLRQEQCQI